MRPNPSVAKWAGVTQGPVTQGVVAGDAGVTQGPVTQGAVEQRPVTQGAVEQGKEPAAYGALTQGAGAMTSLSSLTQGAGVMNSLSSSCTTSVWDHQRHRQLNVKM